MSIKLNAKGYEFVVPTKEQALEGSQWGALLNVSSIQPLPDLFEPQEVEQQEEQQESEVEALKNNLLRQSTSESASTTTASASRQGAEFNSANNGSLLSGVVFDPFNDQDPLGELSDFSSESDESAPFFEISVLGEAGDIDTTFNFFPEPPDIKPIVIIDLPEPALVATIIINPLSENNLFNAAEISSEAQGETLDEIYFANGNWFYTVTGTVGGDVEVGDTVTLTSDSDVEYTGEVEEGEGDDEGKLIFSIPVLQEDLTPGAYDFWDSGPVGGTELSYSLTASVTIGTGVESVTATDTENFSTELFTHISFVEIFGIDSGGTPGAGKGEEEPGNFGSVDVFDIGGGGFVIGPTVISGIGMFGGKVDFYLDDLEEGNAPIEFTLDAAGDLASDMLKITGTGVPDVNGNVTFELTLYDDDVLNNPVIDNLSRGTHSFHASVTNPVGLVFESINYIFFITALAVNDA